MSAKLKNAIKAVNKAALIYGSVSTLALSGVAFAQEDGMMEEIEVTGIRSALKNAMDIKRNSTAVVDAVSAEDIGKFPDNNVAEALGRIPGVTVSRQFGEGSAVSIRGASNALTLTTLNGQNVASAGWYSQQANDRTFNYSMLAPEMIAGIKVYKSSQADLLEGGVGGTVIVETRKPLDLDANSIFGSVKVTDSTASDELDKNFSGMYSWKNDAESFGILAAYSNNEYTLERRGDEALIGWGGRIAPTHFLQERERETIDLAAQFRPTDAIEFGFHYMNMELGADSANSQLWIPADNGDGCQQTNEGGACTVTNTSQAWIDDNAVGSYTYWESRPRLATMETELFDADFTFEGDGFTLDAKIGKSEATGGTNLETNAAFITNIGGVSGVIDASGNKVDWSGAVGADVLAEDLPTGQAGEEYFGWEGLVAGNIVREPRSDEETYAQVDLDFDVEFGAIKSIETGVRWSDHDVKQAQSRPDLRNYTDDTSIPGANYATDGTISVGFAGFTMAEPDAGYILDLSRAAAADGWVEDRSAFTTLNEKTFAMYVMANFEGDSFDGNFGFRYIETDAESDAYALDPTVVDPVLSRNNGYSTVITTTDHDYSDILPSLNLNFDISEDVKLRFSAASVIARPNYQDMFTNASLSGYDDLDDNNQNVVVGTPELSPFKAFQSDLALEWYYADGSMLSVGYFMKDVDTFTTFSTEAGVSIGIVDPGTNADSWSVQSKEDGKGGEIDGVEIQLQHAFDNGFGVLANYTYANGNAESSNYDDGIGSFTDSSDHTYNVVGYYENDVWSARAAYSWRSEYMIRETGFYGAREHQDFGTLDLSAAWNVTDNITVTFDATNVLEEDSIQLGTYKTGAPNPRFTNGYPVSNYEGEARYSLGAQFRF